MAPAEFAKVQKALSGVHYPASKQDLIEHARHRWADNDVLEALSIVPNRRYDNADEVSRASVIPW